MEQQTTVLAANARNSGQARERYPLVDVLNV